MNNVTRGKKTFAIAMAVVVALCLLAIPAYGFYYTHNGDALAEEGQGTFEVFCVVDETEAGGGITSSLIFVPAGSTADAVLDEAVMSSESQNGLEAIHDYSTVSLRDYLDGKDYTCDVYAAGAQQPGTHTTYDSPSIGGEDAQLERYSNVVFTVSE